MSSADASRPLASFTRRVQVMSWLISRMARIGFSSVMSRSTTFGSSSMRSRIDVVPILRNVVYSLMLESPTITCSRRYFSASACGSSRVLMIGRLRVVAERHAFPDVLGPLREAEHGAARRLQHLAGAGVDLARDEERDQHFAEVTEVVAAARQVVLVTAVAVAGGVGVVLEQVDDAADAFLAQPLLGFDHEAFERALPRLVVDDEVADGVALGRGVFGVAADVEVQARAVLEEHVRGASPRHDAAEQVASDFVGAEAALATQRARDAVLVLEPEDAPLHVSANAYARYA